LIDTPENGRTGRIAEQHLLCHKTTSFFFVQRSKRLLR